MDRIEELLDKTKLNELLGKKVVVVEEPKKKHTVLWVFAIIGAICAIAAAAFVLYKKFVPNYEDCLDDDFDDFDEEEEEEQDIYEDESIPVTKF